MTNEQPLKVRFESAQARDELAQMVQETIAGQRQYICLVIRAHNPYGDQMTALHAFVRGDSWIVYYQGIITAIIEIPEEEGWLESLLEAHKGQLTYAFQGADLLNEGEIR